MKKIRLIFALLILVNVSIFTQEQEIERNFTIQASPLLFVSDLISLGIGDDTSMFFIMDLEGQYKINDIFNISLTVSFFVNNSDVIDSVYYNYYPTYYEEINSHNEKGFQINFKPMFIYRPFRTGLKGFYVGVYPSIGWQSYEIRYYGRNEGKVDNYLWTEISLGINLGYKWVFRNGFTLQLGTGIGKTWSIPEPDFFSIINSDGRLTLINFDLHILDFKLGYSF
jgi:hypothetical protein